MLKNIFKILGIFILGVTGGIFGSQILWPYFVERPLFYQYRLERNPIYLTETKEIVITENVALENAVEKVRKTVIGIKAKTTGGKYLEGSGLILTNDGLVVTLADLVPPDSSSIFLFIDDLQPIEIFPKQILKKDLKNNLVLLKVEKRNFPTVSFSDINKVKLGQRVFLISAVFEKENVKKIVNEGIISSLDNGQIETNILERKRIVGSPLFDIKGDILGLNMIDKNGKVITIPVDKIKEFSGF